MASLCMFGVLTASVLGLHVWAPFPAWLTLVLIVLLGAFTFRWYRSMTPLGWG